MWKATMIDKTCVDVSTLSNLGVILDEWTFTFILTLRQTEAVSRAWQAVFTRRGRVGCEKDSPLPSHVHHSSISLGSLAMVRSLFSSLWLSNGPLLPSCHHERWRCLCSVLSFFVFVFFFWAHPFNRRGNPNWDLYPGWFIWCMGLHRVNLFSLFYSVSLSYIFRTELHCLYRYEPVSGCIFSTLLSITRIVLWD